MAETIAGHESNLLLSILPAREQRRLLRHLELVTLQAGEVLVEPGQPIESVYFPLKGCLISMSQVLSDGKCVDVALVGYSGVLGVEVVLGVDVAQFRKTVRVGGTALRLNAEVLRAECRRSDAVSSVLRHYLQYLFSMASQVAACNCFHQLDGHFTSWLLVIHDQLVGNEVEITHEVFAQMLGVRRVGISSPTIRLKRAGLIRNKWGKLTILNRKRLESHACSCYQQLTQAYQRLLDPAWPYR